MVGTLVEFAGEVAALDAEVGVGERIGKKGGEKNGEVADRRSARARGVTKPGEGGCVVGEECDDVAAIGNPCEGVGREWVCGGGLDLFGADPQLNE